LKGATVKNQKLASGVLDLRTNDIEPHPLNPRKEFTHQELLSLGESLRAKGHLQPIMVRPAPADSRRRYQIVFGERRWRAAAFVGLETIRAEVRELSDLEALELMGEENLQRKEWNAMELAEFFAMLKRPESEGGFSLTDAAIGRQFGMAEVSVTNIRRLLRLPESIQRKVQSGELLQTTARALVPYADRPEVMREIEREMKRAPEDWRRRRQRPRSRRAMPATTAR
jgi:ParB family chromosome partitioning protein